MVTVGTLQTGYPYAQDLSQVQRHQTPHPAREGSDVATCPVTPGLPPDEGGLRCQQCPAVSDLPSGAGGLWRHGVSRGTRPASRQGRAPVSPCVPWFQTRLLVREGSSVTTWHMALGVLWATTKRETLSWSTYLAGPIYLQHVTVRSREA
jgi:hypothetical protein